MTMDATTTKDKTVSVKDVEGINTSLGFMEEVETHLTYKIASYINYYWFPVLVPIGLIGNTLSFFVMIQPNNRKMSTCIYMAAISVNDNLMMYLALHNWLGVAVKIVTVQEVGPWGCKIPAYLVHFSLQSSAYQVLAMTIDKYVAIKWPHKAATYSTPGRAKIILSCILLCALIYNSPHLLVASWVGDQCFTYVNGGIISKIYSWISFLVNGIIPFSLLIHMNYLIVQTVRNSRKMFRSNTYATGTEIVPDTDKRQRTMKSAENQLTIMLLLVTMLFLILLFPVYIRFIYISLGKNDTPSKYASSMLFSQITYKLFTTNHGINFLLYCISGKKFRHDLREMLRNITNSNSSSYVSSAASNKT